MDDRRDLSPLNICIRMPVVKALREQRNGNRVRHAYLPRDISSCACVFSELQKTDRENKQAHARKTAHATKKTWLLPRM